MFKRVLIFFIILTSLQLFNFSFLGEQVIKIADIAGIGLTLVIIILQLVYSQKDGFRMYFKWEITIIIASVFISMFMAYSAHNQSLATTILAQRFMYFYLIYFALHQIRIKDTDLEKFMVFLAVLYVLFYIVQYLAYPKLLFDVRISEERGTVRIFQLGLAYLIISYFYVLNKIFGEFSIKWIILLISFFSIFILMGTRQLLVSVLFLTIIYILLSKRVKSRMLVILLGFVAVIPVAIMFQDIFNNIISLSKEQSVGFEENIRILSGTFFLTDFFPNNFAYITGNGAESLNSSYGQLIQMYKDVFGFFQSDVGIVGDYSKFGAFFLIGVIFILFKVLNWKISSDLEYIKYFYYTVVLISFTGGGFFGESSAIVTICITLYIIDVHEHDKSISDEEDNKDEPYELSSV